MAPGEARIQGFVQALLRAGSAPVGSDGTCRIASGRRTRALGAEQLRELAADGVVTLAGGACLPALEARTWLRRRRSLGDPHAAQHRAVVTATGGVQVNLAESPLTRLAASGKSRPAFLAPHHLEAGERVRRLTERARLEPRTTLAYSPERTVGTSQAGSGVHDLSDMAVDARRALDRIRAVLPPDCASVVFDVCGHLKGLQTVEAERGWPRRSAKLVLRIALDQLAAHFGLSQQAQGPGKGRNRTWHGPDARPTEFG